MNTSQVFQTEHGSWPTLKFPFSTQPRPVAKAVVWQADVVFGAVAAPVLVVAVVTVTTAEGTHEIIKDCIVSANLSHFTWGAWTHLVRSSSKGTIPVVSTTL